MTTVKYLAEPDLDRALNFISSAVAQRDMIVMVVKCSIAYEGRGASRLGEGDRLVIVKPDGAVLVHRPTGYSPVNWQPDSHVITVEKQDDRILFRSVRKRPREVLEILISRVYFVVAIHRLLDDAEFIEYLDESEIADYLARYPDLIEEGLRVVRRERPVEGGYADIVAVDKQGRYVVIEVKRVTAGVDAVKQLHRYVEMLRKANAEAKVRGILVAPAITKDALSLLTSLGLEYKHVDIARIHKKAKQERRQNGSLSLLDFIGKR